MDEMIPANGKQITVTAENHHIHVRFGQFKSGGKGNGPTMSSVVRIHIQIPGHPSGTTYARNNSTFIDRDFHTVHGLNKS